LSKLRDLRGEQGFACLAQNAQDVFFMSRHADVLKSLPAFTTLQSSRSLQLQAVAAGALETWVFGNRYMAALFADRPTRPLQHRLALVAQHAIWTTYDLLSHLEGPF